MFRPISKDVHEQRFLTGETLCCFDTELMPKLQHIRVAGKFFVGFEIPESMTHLWSYIREMYQLDAFTQSCPADQVHMHLKMSVVCLSTVVHSEKKIYVQSKVRL